MSPLALFWHLLSFIAPALVLALLVAGAGRLLFPGRGRWWVHVACHTAAGGVVLALGLWHFGVDGKMASYAALVVAVATSQWLCSRAWR
ncbi:hypothetical protein GCM10027034_24370 [Ramlibacter solisilvae]|uniref:Candidate membrane protein n=1 Tax=Ramlibacter tataouinensis TaxID=94132 RepID=A0A127JQ79_9BURK|nr:hypothetical protein [Ramlibacter tataouinensis]AMO22137.1 hypothetical protein UC35_03605 [Ramlibacter tataouinensis]